MTRPGRARRRLGLGALAALGVVVALAVAPAPAAAYPQWQFSSGTVKCGQCHFNPAGGGLIRGYARDAVGEELSTFEGNGDFLWGAVDLPSALALGYDGRGAYLSQDSGNAQGPKKLFIPMQADLYTRFQFSSAWSASITLGMRGQARPGSTEVGPGSPTPGGAASRFVSREHYLMWRPESQGPFVRVGRFFAPYGLRLAEHIFYVRRDLGSNLLEETWSASFGIIKKDWELHATAFAPPAGDIPGLSQFGGNELGAAAMFEKQLGDAAAIGVQSRFGKGPDATRIMGGATGKLYVEAAKTLLLVQGDLVNSRFQAGTPAANGLVAYGGLTVFPVKGVWLSGFGEVSQTSIAVKDSATKAYGGQINWFPLPHWELTFMYRIQAPAGQEKATTVMLLGHLYL